MTWSFLLFLHLALIGPQVSDVLSEHVLPDSPHNHSPIDTMLLRYATYNHWANTRMAEWLAGADEEMMTRTIESSFPTLRQTVLHIWTAEHVWLASLREQAAEPTPMKSFEGSTAELLAGWLAASAAFRDYVAGLTPQELRGHRGGGGDRPPLAVADIVQHCMNHSTYHRGQLITMGRQAGLQQPPRTDFIYYVRE